MSSFHSDLDRGSKIERKVLDIIKNKYRSASLVDAYKGYDIWVPETNCGVEVK